MAVHVGISFAMLTDSIGLFKVINKTQQTTERRIMIDINVAKEGYENEEIDVVGWKKTTDNVADSFTKSSTNMMLEALLDTENLNPKVLE